MSSISPAILLASPLSVYFLPIGKSYINFANRQSCKKKVNKQDAFLMHEADYLKINL